MKAIIWDFKGTLYNPKEEKLFKEASKILELTSKQYKQALITTTFDRKRREDLIKSMGIWEVFDYIRITIKTPKIFLTVCNKFQCKPEDVYVIGDGYIKEIRVGNKLGMKTIWVDRTGRISWKDKLFRKRYWKKVRRLRELEKILK